MKRILAAVALLTSLFGVGAQAQTTTTYYGLIKDLAGNPVTSGKVTFTLRPSTDVTQSGLARFTTQTITCPIASTGNVVGLANSNVTATTGTTSPGTSVTVASATGFANGQPIVIAGAGAAGAVYVGAISNIVSNTFTISPATLTSVSAGAAVYTGCQVTMNTALQPQGSGYLLKFWPGNVNTSTIFTYALNTATDLSTVVSTQAQLPSVGGFLDLFSNQTIGGNKTFTGTTVFSGAGIFTNSQMNLATQALLNGISPSTEFVASHPSIGFTTDAFTAGVLIPSTATVLEVNAHGGYVQSLCNSAGDTKCVGIAAYFQGRANANGASVQGVNSLVQDQVGITGAYLKNEFDLNLNGSPVYATFLQLNGVGVGTFPAPVAIAAPCTNVGAAVLDIYSPFCNSGNPANPAWPLGFAFRRGSLVKDATGVQLEGCLGFANIPCGSYKISMTGYDAGNVAHTGFVAANSAGDVVVTPFAGSALRAPIEIPASLGPTFNNLAFVDGSTNTTTRQVADAAEGYPVNSCTNCLRGKVIYSPPEFFTGSPFPPNFAAELILMAGIVNTTTCTFSNFACHVTDVPIPIRPNTTIRGLVGPVNSNGNMSGGNLIIPGPNYPFAVGIPTLAAITCTGTGGPGGTYDMAVQMVVNLETHAGATPIPGHSAYVKQHVVCGAGTSTMNIPAPTGGQAGSLTVVDYTIGNSANGANGDYFIQRPTVSVTCGLAGTVDSTNDCKISGGASTITLASMQTCTTSACTQPMEADDEEGFPVDTSNMMFPMGANQPVSFLMSFGNMSVACLNAQTNVPFVVFGNVSGQEGSGVGNNGHVVVYGNCGSNLAGISGAFVYAFSQSPNSMWAHMQISGGPTSGAIPNYCFILDGRPNDGGASGAARTISDVTCALRGGGTKNRGLLAQGFRVHTGISETHWECNNGVDCLYVTNGARVEIVNGEAFTTGNSIHLTATAGPSTIKSFGAQGANSSIQDRFLSTAVAVQDDGVGGGTYKGYLTDWSSGTTLTRFLQLNPMTFANLTAQITCAAAAEGSEASVIDDNTALAFNATITGGGTNHVHGYCNGTNWVMQ